MKKAITIISLLFLIVSCTVYTYKEYEITISLKNMTEDKDVYIPINDIEHSIEPLKLTKENNFTDKRYSIGLGKQTDLRYPKEGSVLKRRLEQIRNGEIYTIEELTPEGKSVPKYVIQCQKDDVKEIIDDRLYRHYEITLDWNKKVPLQQ